MLSCSLANERQRGDAIKEATYGYCCSCFASARACVATSFPKIGSSGSSLMRGRSSKTVLLSPNVRGWLAVHPNGSTDPSPNFTAFAPHVIVNVTVPLLHMSFEFLLPPHCLQESDSCEDGCFYDMVVVFEVVCSVVHLFIHFY